jgi:hypothetical protein
MAIDIAAISVIILRVSIHRVTSLFRMLDKYLLKLIVPMSTANVSRTLPTQETNSLRLKVATGWQLSNGPVGPWPLDAWWGTAT